MSSQKISFYDESLNILFSSETSSDEEQSILKVNSNKENIAIIASNDFSFYKFDLPTTSKRNLKKVIPFMLSEEILGEVEDYFWIQDSQSEIVGIIEHQKILEINKPSMHVLFRGKKQVLQYFHLFLGYLMLIQLLLFHKLEVAILYQYLFYCN